MKQPSKKERIVNGKKPKTKKLLRKPNGKLDRPHPKFGTSKLEKDFAHNFLDKLGVEYIWQFEAKDIGRFFDYLVFTKKSHSPVLVECDGSYYHSDPRVVTEDKIKPMHKKNARVDKMKNEWALLHGIPIMRIWEKDIRENPKWVMEQLKERLAVEDEIGTVNKEKNKRHKNKLKK